jgi:hypothetical protein
MLELAQRFVMDPACAGVTRVGRDAARSWFCSSFLRPSFVSVGALRCRDASPSPAHSCESRSPTEDGRGSHGLQGWLSVLVTWHLLNRRLDSGLRRNERINENRRFPISAFPAKAGVQGVPKGPSLDVNAQCPAPGSPLTRGRRLRGEVANESRSAFADSTTNESRSIPRIPHSLQGQCRPPS